MRALGRPTVLALTATAKPAASHCGSSKALPACAMPMGATTIAAANMPIGVAMAPADASQAEELLRYADIALYEAKEAGRNTWCFYASDMNDRMLERRKLENDLRQAKTTRYVYLGGSLVARVVTDTDRLICSSASSSIRAIVDFPAPEGEERMSKSPLRRAL